MASRRRFGDAVLRAAVGVLVVGLVASSWLVAARELANRRLYLEFEVYKALTTMSDLVRAGGLSTGDTENVLAFGMYGPDGAALYRYGDAPPSLPVPGIGQPANRYSLRRDSVVLTRAMGAEMAGRRGRPLPGRVGEGMMRPGEPAPTMAFIELGLGEYRRGRATLVGLAVVSTLVLAGLYLIVLRVLKRNQEYRDRESMNRELVELGEAARTIAHEIKNPLGVIRVQCGLLRKLSGPEASEGIDMIESETMRLSGMADRIRGYLRGTRPTDLTPISAKPWLEDFAARYASRVEARIDVPADVSVLIEEERVREALDNLVANALEAEAEAGTGGLPVVEAGLRQGSLRVDVLDHGPGVAPEHRRRLFEPFFSTKARGTGLGLALARTNVEASGGTLAYADRSGGGSMFTVTLPTASLPTASLPSAPQPR